MKWGSETTLRAKTVHPWHRNSLIFYFLKPLCCRDSARTASLRSRRGAMSPKRPPRAETPQPKPFASRDSPEPPRTAAASTSSPDKEPSVCPPGRAIFAVVVPRVELEPEEKRYASRDARFRGATRPRVTRASHRASAFARTGSRFAPRTPRSNPRRSVTRLFRSARARRFFRPAMGRFSRADPSTPSLPFAPRNTGRSSPRACRTCLPGTAWWSARAARWRSSARACPLPARAPRSPPKSWRTSGASWRSSPGTSARPTSPTRSATPATRTLRSRGCGRSRSSATCAA